MHRTPRNAPSRSFTARKGRGARVARAGAAMCVVAASLPVRAQCTPQWLPEPGSEHATLGVEEPSGNFGAHISCFAVAPNGDVIVGGTFTVAGGITTNSIARFNPATRAWSGLGSGLTMNGDPGQVSTVHVMPNGDVVAGGFFNSAGGVSASYIARFSAATSTWSALGSGVNNVVNSLDHDAFGNLYVGGQFSSAGGQPSTQGLARYTSAGAWTPVGPAGIGGFNPSPKIDSVHVAPNGDLYIHDALTPAGVPAFHKYTFCTPQPSCSGVWSNYLPSYTPGPLGTPGGLIALASGDIYTAAPGVFTGWNCTKFLLSNSTNSPMGLGVNNFIQSMVLSPSGEILAVGPFTTGGGNPGTPMNHVAKYTVATDTWASLAPIGLTHEPSAVIALPNGDVLVGGSNVQSMGGIACAGRLTRYLTSENRWELNFGVDGEAHAAVRLPGGDYIVGGQFARAGRVSASNIARYNPTTGAWSALGQGTNNAVHAMAMLPGGDVIVGGAFTSAGGVAVTQTARYNPTTGTWTGFGTGSRPLPVFAFTITPTGDVVAGGASSSPSTRAVKWSASTNAWTSLGSVGSGGAFGVGHRVLALAAASNGDIYIAGDFPDNAGLGLERNFVYWNSVSNTIVAPSGGPDLAVHALGVLANGTVVLGGQFNTLDTTPARALGTWNPTTSSWSALTTGAVGSVRTLSVLPDGAIAFGGDYFLFGRGLARVNPTTGEVTTPYGGVSGAPVFAGVNVLLPGAGGDMFAAGNFQSGLTPMSAFDSRKTPLNNVGVWACPPANGCDSIDFNNDGLFPDTADIDDFLSVFSGGACSTAPVPGCNDVDFNNDGLFPDTTDIDSLLSVFSGGPCL